MKDKNDVQYKNLVNKYFSFLKEKQGKDLELEHKRLFIEQNKKKFDSIHQIETFYVGLFQELKDNMKKVFEVLTTQHNQ